MVPSNWESRIARICSDLVNIKIFSSVAFEEKVSTFFKKAKVRTVAVVISLQIINSEFITLKVLESGTKK